MCLSHRPLPLLPAPLPTHTQAQQLLGVLIPVLQLLTNDNMTQPHHLNPVYATVHGCLDLAAVAAVLEGMAQHPEAGQAGFLQRQQQHGEGARVMVSLGGLE